MDALVAVSFCSTLSIALSKALPIKNSRERSVSVRCGFAYDPATPTIYPLLVDKSLALLCLVPVQYQAVPEGQSRARISGALVAIVQRPRKCRLDVSDGLPTKLIGRSEGLRRLGKSQCALRCLPCPATYKLSPCLSLGLWNAGLDALDLAGPKAGDSSLVLGAREVLRADRALKVRERSAD